MKVALVTGAYKGLGFEWCRHLGRNGYAVILTARELDKAEAAAGQLRSEGCEVYAKSLEVTDESQLRELGAWAQEKFGHMDLIVNNAGVNPKDYADKSRMAKAFYLNELDAQELLSVIHINSIAPLLVVKHFRSLLQQAQKPVVINISSWLGSVSQLSFGGHYGYTGSKNLLNIFNKSMANELKQDQIICINVNPGWVQTDMGGSKAQFTPAQSVANIWDHVFSRLTLADSGRFIHFDGSDHPW